MGQDLGGLWVVMGGIFSLDYGAWLSVLKNIQR